MIFARQNFPVRMALLAFLALGNGPSGAAPAVKRLVFDLFREGYRIGAHETTITRDGVKTTLDTHTQVEVKVMGLTAYVYDFLAQEIWLDGKFDSFVSATDDNGAKHLVKIDRKDGKLIVKADGKTSSVAPDAVPDSFWNEALLRSNPNLTAIAIETGKVNQVSVKSLGEEPGPHGQKLDHYKIGGAMERDIWFSNHDPYRYQLKARDGSIIESKLR